MKGRSCKGGRSRGKRGGGTMSPLASGSYPGSLASGGQWSASVGGNSLATASNDYKSFLGGFADKSGGPGANPALAREMVAGYAMKGPGQSGGGSRRKRHHKRGKKHGSRSRKTRMSQGQAQGQSQAQSQSQSQAQSGGMIATFGALLKEALVPLGLLAAQQTYGKSYDSKRRTRKNRK
jgi:hypothetical protein